MKLYRQKWILVFIFLFGMNALHAQQLRYVQVRIADGVLEGVVSPDGKVRTFKGIPYAASPIGSLRWKVPQPVAPWTGVRKAVDYPKRAMQGRIFDDMVFNDGGPSEDCLYLNLWMPENHHGKLPVMVWIHGRGFAAGSSSEPRQDAGNLSKKGVMVVSFNYRLGVFGFFAHPELTKESEHHASGNYGLLDQIAALEWIKKNIAAFGGDPDNVTIFGESAGSFSVSALMASPLSIGLFNRAIGESGAFFGTSLPLISRVKAEKAGVEFADSAFGTSSLKRLRAMPAQKLLEAALKLSWWSSFRQDIDGYFLPADCRSIYAVGNQRHIPLLAGWNKDEGNFHSFFDTNEPTVANYIAHARIRFGSDADTFLKVYPAVTSAEAKRAAADFAGDDFIAYSTWKWLEMQLRTGESPVFRYEFDQTLPLPVDAKPGTEATASHSWEIEFVFQVLSSRNLPWRPEDYKVSDLMASYWTNFAKRGDPNGPDLPRWPEYKSTDGYQVMHFEGVNSGPAPDKHRNRYEFLEHMNTQP